MGLRTERRAKAPYTGTGPTIAFHLHGRALRFGLLLAISVAVSLGVGPSLPGAVAPAGAAIEAAFDPVAFFSGRTESHGTLDQIAASPKASHVTGLGSLRADGVFVIDQTVRIAGDPVKQRRWQLRETSPGRFSGTLSDASGPVTGVVTGKKMQIAYSMKGGMKVSQVFTLSADGRSLANSMKIRKFGIVVATYVETIRKL